MTKRWNFFPGGIFDVDGQNYSASAIAFNMAIAEINADTSILNGVTLEGISNKIAPLDVKQSVDSGELLKTCASSPQSNQFILWIILI